MAQETGTATGPTDFFNKLQTFITSNVDLVNDGGDWDVAWTNGDQRVFRSTGSGGNDLIYVGAELVQDVNADEAFVRFRGMTGFDINAIDLDLHLNLSEETRLFLDFHPFTYWFWANARRFMIGLKVSTTFQVGYFGFLLPYALPTLYRDPVFIAGMSRTARSWRDESITHFAQASDLSASVLNASYVWRELGGGGAGVWPTGTENIAANTRLSAGNVEDIFGRMSDALGGDQVLIPLTIYDSTDGNVLGAPQGMNYVKGLRQSAEATITIDGTDHLVFQNAYRTGPTQYVTVEME